MNAISSEFYENAPERGIITILGAEMDALYVTRLKTLLLKPSLQQAHPPRSSSPISTAPAATSTCRCCAVLVKTYVIREAIQYLKMALRIQADVPFAREELDRINAAYPAAR